MIFPPVEDQPTTPVIRLIRRICLLREQGDAAGARALERDELPPLLQAARASLGPDALPEDELRQVFARESERAAEAITIAGLIVQQLAAHSSGSVPAANVCANREREPHVAKTRERASPGAAPAIADLLDAMLASESRARSH